MFCGDYNNKIQKNKFSLFYRNWLWSGSIFKKLFQKENQTKIIKTKLPKDLHYIEFWADRMPILHKVTFKLGQINIPKPIELTEPTALKAKVVWKTTRLRTEPKVDKQNILIEEIKKGEEVVILEKAIKGDRPKVNKKGVLGDSNRWHKAKYQGQVGYIYSEALEIKGEDRETIKNFTIKTSKELGEDSDLMLAISEQESNFFPYDVSYDKDHPEIAYGVMQITFKAIKQVKDTYQYEVTDKFNIQQNIEGGIRNFQFVRTKFNKNMPNYLDKLLVGWNAGPYYIREEDKEKPLNQIYIPPQTEIFIENVKKFYKRNQKKNRSRGFIKYLLITGLAGALFVGVWQSQNTGDVPRSLGEVYQIISDEVGENEEWYQLDDDLDADGQIENLQFRYQYFQDRGRRTEVRLNDQIFELRGSFSMAHTKNVIEDDTKEVIIDLAVGVNGNWTEIYTYRNGKLRVVPIVAGTSTFNGILGRGVEFVDYNDDGDLEIRSHYRVSNVCENRSDIYEYIKEKFILTDQILTYKPTCREMIKEFKD